MAVQSLEEFLDGLFQRFGLDGPRGVRGLRNEVPRAEEPPGLLPEEAGGARRVESVVSDLPESKRQNVDKEAVQEDRRGQGGDLADPGGERDHSLRGRDDAAVRDRDPVGVPPEVLQDVGGAAEGALGEDHPLPFLRQRAEQGDPLVVGQAQLRGRLETMKVGEDGGAEDRLHPLRREEEARSRQPAGTVEAEPTAGDDAVEVRVEAEVPLPGVKHGRDAEAYAERLLGQPRQGLGGGIEEQSVQPFGMAPGERTQLGWKREDDVVVPDGQQDLPTLLDPLVLREGLAVGTVTVAAAVVDRELGVALVADVEVAAERRRAAAVEVSQIAGLLRGRPMPRPPDVESRAQDLDARSDPARCRPGGSPRPG